MNGQVRPPKPPRPPRGRRTTGVSGRTTGVGPRPGAPGARVRGMSHPDPSLVDVRTLADHPLAHAGAAGMRMVVPGSRTQQRYGLAEYRLAPHSPGASPHYHQTFSEAFYVLSGRPTFYAEGEWRP